jgi:hypothetical protein
MDWATEVRFRFHSAVETVRRQTRDAVELGMPPEALRDVLRSNLLALVEGIVGLPTPCGVRFSVPAVPGCWQLCSRERGHAGKHEGNL